MAEDSAAESGLPSEVSCEAALSPGAIVGLLLEIQTSLLEKPEHAHLCDTAEDLLFGLVRSMKNAEAPGAAGNAQPGKPALTASGRNAKPRLRIVTNS